MEKWSTNVPLSIDWELNFEELTIWILNRANDFLTGRDLTPSTWVRSLTFSEAVIVSYFTLPEWDLGYVFLIRILEKHEWPQIVNIFHLKGHWKSRSKTIKKMYRWTMSSELFHAFFAGSSAAHSLCQLLPYFTEIDCFASNKVDRLPRQWL
jgi:hypothetical protein